MTINTIGDIDFKQHGITLWSMSPTGKVVLAPAMVAAVRACIDDLLRSDQKHAYASQVELESGVHSPETGPILTERRRAAFNSTKSQQSGREFQNRLKLLFSLDATEAGLPRVVAERFHRDPFAFVIRASDDDLHGIFAAIERRAPKGQTDE